MRKGLLAGGMVCVLALVSWSMPTGAANDLRELARQATSTDSKQSTAAIAQLRAAGPAGLALMLDVYANDLKSQRSGRPAPAASSAGQWTRLSSALDAVAQQHDAYSAGLYWYTNLDDAKAAAKASGKPILSLRLLGKLSEDRSCANSRFFRTVLYANADVAAYLREHFILHWQSVRPVPTITIDFGDGRKIERTITGNSCHYILTSAGRPIDAIPGLYGPTAFLRVVKEAEQAALAYQAASDSATAEAGLRGYHFAQEAALEAEWTADMAKVGSVTVKDNANLAILAAPAAARAGALARTKSGVELPMIAQVAPSPATAQEDAFWARVAALHGDDALLDSGSVALIKAKNPDAVAAGRLTISKLSAEAPLIAMVMQFERSIAQDTVRNEYTMHSTIHDWFANGDAPSDLSALNEKIYTELFLTPSSDPWLGLVPPNTYSGLDNDGVCIGK